MKIITSGLNLSYLRCTQFYALQSISVVTHMGDGRIQIGLVRQSGTHLGPIHQRACWGRAGRGNRLISGGSGVNQGRNRGALSLTHTNTHAVTVSFILYHWVSVVEALKQQHLMSKWQNTVKCFPLIQVCSCHYLNFISFQECMSGTPFNLNTDVTNTHSTNINTYMHTHVWMWTF